VAQLRESREVSHRVRHQGCVRELPSREALQHVLETAILGERVRLYQAVTLGAKRFPADEHGNLIKGNARHPIVEDDVVIYAGAMILGRITIGKGSTIGGNVWLTHSVEAGSNISQAHMRNE
jgi:serine O-acetyltransferase